MNGDILLGKWRQIRGYFKQTIGKFSGDYLLEADGIGDRMQGVLQERYGYSKEQAQEEWGKFTQKHVDRATGVKADLNAAVANVKTAANHVKNATKR